MSREFILGSFSVLLYIVLQFSLYIIFLVAMLATFYSLTTLLLPWIVLIHTPTYLQSEYHRDCIVCISLLTPPNAIYDRKCIIIKNALKILVSFLQPII